MEANDPLLPMDMLHLIANSVADGLTAVALTQTCRSLEKCVSLNQNSVWKKFTEKSFDLSPFNKFPTFSAWKSLYFVVAYRLDLIETLSHLLSVGVDPSDISLKRLVPLLKESKAFDDELYGVLFTYLFLRAHPPPPTVDEAAAVSSKFGIYQSTFADIPYLHVMFSAFEWYCETSWDAIERTELSVSYRRGNIKIRTASLLAVERIPSELVLKDLNFTCLEKLISRGDIRIFNRWLLDKAEYAGIRDHLDNKASKLFSFALEHQKPDIFALFMQALGAPAERVHALQLCGRKMRDHYASLLRLVPMNQLSPSLLDVLNEDERLNMIEFYKNEPKVLAYCFIRAESEREIQALLAAGIEPNMPYLNSTKKLFEIVSMGPKLKLLIDRGLSKADALLAHAKNTDMLKAVLSTLSPNDIDENVGKAFATTVLKGANSKIILETIKFCELNNFRILSYHDAAFNLLTYMTQRSITYDTPTFLAILELLLRDSNTDTKTSPTPGSDPLFLLLVHTPVTPETIRCLELLQKANYTFSNPEARLRDLLDWGRFQWLPTFGNYFPVDLSKSVWQYSQVHTMDKETARALFGMGAPGKFCKNCKAIIAPENQKRKCEYHPNDCEPAKREGFVMYRCCALVVPMDEVARPCKLGLHDFIQF